jgi:hypothetical protein
LGPRRDPNAEAGDVDGKGDVVARTAPDTQDAAAEPFQAFGGGEKSSCAVVLGVVVGDRHEDPFRPDAQFRKEFPKAAALGHVARSATSRLSTERGFAVDHDEIRRGDPGAKRRVDVQI